MRRPTRPWLRGGSVPLCAPPAPCPLHSAPSERKWHLRWASSDTSGLKVAHDYMRWARSDTGGQKAVPEVGKEHQRANHSTVVAKKQHQRAKVKAIGPRNECEAFPYFECESVPPPTPPPPSTHRALLHGIGMELPIGTATHPTTTHSRSGTGALSHVCSLEKARHRQ